MFVKVGLPEKGILKAGTAKGSGAESAKDMSDMIIRGAVHEFGAPNKNIPERSWLRAAYDANLAKIDRQIANAFDAVSRGKADAEQALGLLGEWFVAVIRRHINAMILPALQPRTIKRKKSSKLLIDTGQLRQSIQWVLGKF
jgi:hypothetical protein